MFDMNLVGTMGMALGLVGGAAVALWLLPWSEKDLRAANEDLSSTVNRASRPFRGDQRHPRLAAH